MIRDRNACDDLSKYSKMPKDYIDCAGALRADRCDRLQQRLVGKVWIPFFLYGFRCLRQGFYEHHVDENNSLAERPSAERSSLLN